MSSAYLESSVLQNKVADIYIDDKLKKKKKILIDYNNPDHFLNSFFYSEEKNYTFTYLRVSLCQSNKEIQYNANISLSLQSRLQLPSFTHHGSFSSVLLERSIFSPPTRFNISRTLVFQYLPPHSQGQ